MSTQRLRIIVTGYIAQYPFGGVTWDYLQYPLGLARLGHDVYYFEDTHLWPYNPIERGISARCDFNVKYLAATMARFGLADRWAYFAHEGSPDEKENFPVRAQWFGLPESERRSVIRTADLLINVSFSLTRPYDYHIGGRRAGVDSDPVFTQVKLARGQEEFRKIVDAHEVHFSFGERLTYKVPATGHRWRPTRQPIVLPEWTGAAEQRPVFTTVMNWSSYKPVTFQNQVYGQKDLEFAAYLDLPQRVRPSTLELAVAAAGKVALTPVEELCRNNWRLVDPMEVCPDLDSYRRYIQSSRAEWSVAKNGYVVGQPGWFSCRSACYLAAGRPVVVQDTGFSSVLPVGEGILTFTNIEEAVDAIRAVESDYPRHSRAARSIAEEYFDSDKVLTNLVEEAMASRA